MRSDIHIPHDRHRHRAGGCRTARPRPALPAALVRRAPVLLAAVLLTPGASPAQEPAADPGRERRSVPGREAGTVLPRDTGLDSPSLEELVREARRRNPGILAAVSDVRSAEERIARAGTWEDPALTFGFINLRTDSFEFSDDLMTMKVLQLGQEIPLPGQLEHRERAAALRAQGTEHDVDGVRVRVTAEVKRAYAELYYLDRALEIVERHLTVLRGLEDVTRTRYTTGVGRQPAVLRAGLEIDGLAAQQVALKERRRSALAALNALRDRPGTVEVDSTALPPALRALPSTERRGGGFSSALRRGPVGATGSLPPLDSLVRLAIRSRPLVRSHVARIQAQAEAVELARALRWPAPRLNLGYGQRSGDRADMMNATVTFRLPIFSGSKQAAVVREERAVLARERSRHDLMVREIERQVTAAHAAVAEQVGRLVLYERGILDRSRANLEASLAAYRSGAEDFLTLLDAQTALYEQELDYHRRLADLLVAWAGLEEAVGREIEP